MVPVAGEGPLPRLLPGFHILLHRVDDLVRHVQVRTSTRSYKYSLLDKVLVPVPTPTSIVSLIRS